MTHLLAIIGSRQIQHKFKVCSFVIWDFFWDISRHIFTLSHINQTVCKQNEPTGLHKHNITYSSTSTIHVLLRGACLCVVTMTNIVEAKAEESFLELTMTQCTLRKVSTTSAFVLFSIKNWISKLAESSGNRRTSQFYLQ